MRPWSIILSATILAVSATGLATSADAQYYSAGIGDWSVAGGRGGVVHSVSCASCLPVRRTRAGSWEYYVPRPPGVDFGQALPIYQPPIQTIPPHVVPVYPVFPRSGAYPVTGSPTVGYQRPLMEPRPFYPTGASARIINVPRAARSWRRDNR